ncbi:MAG: hypothetical protein LBJ00_16455 [Planctomycetaceae bacterium]|nr:hypothetical protein [Planctomycetaceae bacterium]
MKRLFRGEAYCLYRLRYKMFLRESFSHILFRLCGVCAQSVSSSSSAS